jgi:hypothetical protein
MVLVHSDVVFVNVQKEDSVNNVNATVRHKLILRCASCQIQRTKPFAVDLEPVCVENVNATSKPTKPGRFLVHIVSAIILVVIVTRVKFVEAKLEVNVNVEFVIVQKLSWETIVVNEIVHWEPKNVYHRRMEKYVQGMVNVDVTRASAILGTVVNIARSVCRVLASARTTKFAFSATNLTAEEIPKSAANATST